VTEIEVTGREAAGVFAQLPVVQPNRGAELGLVDLEPGHRLPRRSFELLAIPEIVAVLVHLAQPVVGQPGLGIDAAPNAIGNVLPGTELVHVLEGGLGEIGETGHRSLVSELRWHLGGGRTFPDLPGAVEGECRPIRPGRGGGADKGGTKGELNPAGSHDASMSEARGSS